VAFAEAGVVTGASDRNWASYGDHVRLAGDLGRTVRPLLCDPQTSGGLLVSCAPDTATAVLDAFTRCGCERAAKIGVMVDGAPVVEVGA
jgi:selenide,water dikinase